MAFPYENFQVSPPGRIKLVFNRLHCISNYIIPKPVIKYSIKCPRWIQQGFLAFNVWSMDFIRFVRITGNFFGFDFCPQSTPPGANSLLLKDFSYSRPETTLKRNWFVIPKLPFYLIFCVRAYSPRGHDYLGAWNRLGHW